MKKVIQDGQAWCSVADAARYLGTTQAKIRGLMGDDRLVYTQLRVNGKLYVRTADLVEIKQSK